MSKYVRTTLLFQQNYCILNIGIYVKLNLIVSAVSVLQQKR